MAGHKFYAPKGVGALYVRTGAAFTPLLHGASQEGGRRAGTENVPYMVALGAACRLARERLPVAAGALARACGTGSMSCSRPGVPGLILNGPEAERLPNTLNVSFPGVAGGELMAGLPEVAASLGSACHAGQEAISPVLAAMGVPLDRSPGARCASAWGFPPPWPKWNRPRPGCGSVWAGCVGRKDDAGVSAGCRKFIAPTAL